MTKSIEAMLLERVENLEKEVKEIKGVPDIYVGNPYPTAVDLENVPHNVCVYNPQGGIEDLLETAHSVFTRIGYYQPDELQSYLETVYVREDHNMELIEYIKFDLEIKKVYFWEKDMESGKQSDKGLESEELKAVFLKAKELGWYEK